MGVFEGFKEHTGNPLEGVAGLSELLETAETRRKAFVVGDSLLGWTCSVKPLRGDPEYTVNPVNQFAVRQHVCRIFDTQLSGLLDFRLMFWWATNPNGRWECRSSLPLSLSPFQGGTDCMRKGAKKRGIQRSVGGERGSFWASSWSNR